MASRSSGSLPGKSCNDGNPRTSESCDNGSCKVVKTGGGVCGDPTACSVCVDGKLVLVGQNGNDGWIAQIGVDGTPAWLASPGSPTRFDIARAIVANSKGYVIAGQQATEVDLSSPTRLSRIDPEGQLG